MRGSRGQRSAYSAVVAGEADVHETGRILAQGGGRRKGVEWRGGGGHVSVCKHGVFVCVCCRG